MARHDLRDELHQQVQASLDKGATCLLGGAVPAGPGAYYPPTVLTQVTKGMPAYDDELFGPVAAIMAVPNEQEAIRVANDSVFGLGQRSSRKMWPKVSTLPPMNWRLAVVSSMPS
jgi:succinate-semialdehyde dehydrogenase/glutarate-semialdehyde dehydrogenase